ncbi:MAG: hypothetical protein M3Q49_01115 [Actinomycetota bacterium]|nr:hypothetical protein [Actinomycetota bacterium]
MTCEDPRFLERQYRDASKLGARIALHRGFEAGEFHRRVAGLTDQLERELASRGEIRITKDAGLFGARR